MNKFLIAFLGCAILLTGLAGAQNQPPNPPVQCTNFAVYEGTTSGPTRLVTEQTGKSVYICGYTLFGHSDVRVDLRYGTGATCTTFTRLTPQFLVSSKVGVVDTSTFFRGLQSASGTSVCINVEGAVSAQGVLYYSHF